MLAFLFLLFIVLPIVEIIVIIHVGEAIGVLPTIALLVLISLAGSALVKREGLSVWRRFQEQVHAGHVPGRELADGVMIVLAGGLLMTPGFVTDAAGVLLLLPPIRAAVRALVVHRATERAQRYY